MAAYLWDKAYKKEPLFPLPPLNSLYTGEKGDFEMGGGEGGGGRLVDRHLQLWDKKSPSSSHLIKADAL